jgi:hypothetical protein
MGKGERAEQVGPGDSPAHAPARLLSDNGPCDVSAALAT